MADTSGGPGATAAGTPGGHAEAAVARLRIHAGRPARSGGPAQLKALWQRWLDGAPKPDASSGAARPRVEVAAGPGRRLIELTDPQGTAEVTLGAGTYDITVVVGDRRRRYTVTLDAGATFDLNLADAMQVD